MKKILMLCFVLSLVSACASRTKVEEDYDVIESQSQADKMNKKSNKNKSQEVDVPNMVYFSFNKYNVSNDTAELLKVQAEWLKNDKEVNIILEGHCDERGTREYNIALGEKRADAVKKYLVRLGVPATRISTISYGKDRPLVLGSGPAVWAKNRVVVTAIVK